MTETMTKINPYDYYDYEGEPGERPKHHKKKRGPPTEADKARRGEEIRLAREARVLEVEEKIRKHLAGFPGPETEEGQVQVKRYILWVEDSLRFNGARFDPENKEEIEIGYFVSSVKAGGQQRQRSHSAVRVIHLPTKIVAQNQDERIPGINKKAAIETLAQRLESHLDLWKTLIQNSSAPIDIEKEVISLLPTKNPQ